MTRIICGVDISSTSLAARIGRSGAQNSFANTPEGIASLAAFCRAHQVDLVAMEATGGYEQQSFAQLWGEGLPVAILNPRQVRQFAQEIGTLSHKSISKLAGVAPLAADSGKRRVRGGRAAVREILFVVASVVAKHEPDFMAFRERLLAAGKPPKVVRIAVAHKLLVRLNAKARDVRRQTSPSPVPGGGLPVAA